MNARLIACIAMGVFVMHIGVIMLLTHLRPQPKLKPLPKPNFIVRTEVVIVDPATGEKTIEREITVTTKLAEPRLLEPVGK